MPVSATGLVALLRKDAALYRQLAGELRSPPARAELLRLASEALEKALAVAFAAKSDPTQQATQHAADLTTNAEIRIGRTPW